MKAFGAFQQSSAKHKFEHHWLNIKKIKAYAFIFDMVHARIRLNETRSVQQSYLNLNHTNIKGEQ